MAEETQDLPPEDAATPAGATRAGDDDALARPLETRQVRLERTYRLDLRVGARLMLRLGWGSEKIMELPAELVGYSHYEFMLARVRPVPGLLNRLNQGELVQVRFLSDGEAAIFQTEIIGHLIRPGVVLVLAYPHTMNTVQVRRHKRLDCALPVRAAKDGWKLSGIISDISRGGCRLVLDMRGQSPARSLAVGDALELVAPLDIEKGLENIQAKIRSIETEQYRMIMGLCFEPMPGRTAQLLEAFLNDTEILLS